MVVVTRRIIGYKQEESDYLLKFLYDHIALGQDFQVRVKWAPRTVVVWDVSHIKHAFCFGELKETSETDAVGFSVEPCHRSLGNARLEQWSATSLSQNYSPSGKPCRNSFRGT